MVYDFSFIAYNKTMKLQLSNKKVEVIPYLTKKQLSEQMPISGFRSVSQVIAPPKKSEWVKTQLKDPTSAFAKATRQGTQMHRALETGNTTDAFIAACLAKFNAEVLVDIDELWGQEEWLAHPFGYKGKFDGVGIYRGQVTLFDHKKTPKRKTPSSLKKWFAQLVAYKQAHEFLYPEHKIEQLAIFNIFGKTLEDVGTNVVVLTPEQVDQFTSEFNFNFVTTL